MNEIELIVGLIVVGILLLKVAISAKDRVTERRRYEFNNVLPSGHIGFRTLEACAAHFAAKQRDMEINDITGKAGAFCLCAAFLLIMLHFGPF